MEADKKVVITLVSASVLIPVFVILLSFVTDTFSSKIMFVAFMMLILLPLIAMGAYMWMTGKGQWAISGYNTMPRSQQEYYDAERLAKDVGKFVMILSIILLMGFSLMFYVPHSTTVLMITLALATGVIIAFLIFARNPRYLKDSTRTPPPPTKEERKTWLIIIGVVVAITAVILVVVFLLIGAGNVDASMNDERLQIKAPMVNEYVYFDEIVSVEIREDMDLGSRIGGFGGKNVLSGNFNNREFGDYILAAYRSVNTYIVVEPSHGKMLVFNRGSVDETIQFYEDLLKNLPSDNLEGLTVPIGTPASIMNTDLCF